MSGQPGGEREPSPKGSQALRYDVAVGEDRSVEVRVPFSPGERVVVIVIRRPDADREDLVAAASTTLAFWDNPFDDEDWGTA